MNIKKILEKELATFDRSIVATPQDRTSLDIFAKANKGSSDAILTQMAVQFGYIQALKFIKKELKIWI